MSATSESSVCRQIPLFCQLHCSTKAFAGQYAELAEKGRIVQSGAGEPQFATIEGTWPPFRLLKKDVETGIIM